MAAEDTTSKSKCPVHVDIKDQQSAGPSWYNPSRWGLLGGSWWSSSSTSSSQEQISAPTTSSSSSSSCPMNNTSKNNKNFADTAGVNKCPVASDKMVEKLLNNNKHSSHGEESDETIDLRNMMPKISQNPMPGDTVAFSKDREVSSIPKTGESENWVYPSPQQFYNAIRKRGKVAKEDELEAPGTMDSIVFAHNVTNEITWNDILKWEKTFHWDRCKDPTLKRFVGLSEDFSMKARWNQYLLHFAFFI